MTNKSLILVIGGIGHGKSSFINSVSEKNECRVGHTWCVDQTITEEVQEVDIKRNEEVFTFVDTPSLWTLKCNSKFQEHFKTGFQAIVLVCSIKSSQSLSPVLHEAKKLIGDDIYHHILIVLSFEDHLENATQEEFLTANIDLKDFSKKTLFECIPFNNSHDCDPKKVIEQRNFFFVNLDAIRRQNNYEVIKGKSVCRKIYSWVWSCFHILIRWIKRILNIDG